MDMAEEVRTAKDCSMWCWQADGPLESGRRRFDSARRLGEMPVSCRWPPAGTGRLPEATKGCLVDAEREGSGPVVRQLWSASIGWYGSIAGSHDRPLPGTRSCGSSSPKRPGGGRPLSDAQRSVGAAAAAPAVGRYHPVGSTAGLPQTSRRWSAPQRAERTSRACIAEMTSHVVVAACSRPSGTG
jgi:hypothetical protein